MARHRWQDKEGTWFATLLSSHSSPSRKTYIAGNGGTFNWPEAEWGGEGNGLKGRLIFPHVPHTRSPPPSVPQLLRSSHAVSLWQRTEGTVQVPRGPAVALGSTFPVRPGSLSLPGPCCVTSDKGLDLSSALNLPLTPIVKSQLGRESGSHSPCRVRD